MNNDLITIVIPIYNVEKYLNECIESLLKQTYKNIEIILVDDGSPDKCGEICDIYALKDNRIKVIHKENGGLSDARNHGIEAATGKYITFIDSDDYVSEKYIEKLYNAIIENDAKISQCSLIKVKDNHEEIEKIGYNKDIKIKSGNDMIKDLCMGYWGTIIACSKLYHMELFRTIRFPIGKVHEDAFVTYKVLYNLDKIAIINDGLYYYRQNENSIMGRQFNLKRMNLLEAVEERLKFFKEKNETELYQLSLCDYLRIIKEHYINIKKYIENSEDIQKELIKKYKENYKILVQLKDINIIKKLKWLLFYISPKMYYKIKG